MNVNGLSAEQINAKAQSLLQNKEKVDLTKEDLEVLWEDIKLNAEDDAYASISDADAITMFDILDNSGNTAATSYKLFMNWLKVAISGNEADAATPSVQTAQAQTPVVQDEQSAAATPATQTAAGFLVETANGPVGNAAAAVSTYSAESANDANQVSSKTLTRGQTYTITVNDKNYSVTNNSSTNNVINWYIDGEQLVLTGSDLVIKAADGNTNKVDNIMVMGNRNEIEMGDGNDVIEVEGDYNMLYGGDGDDHLKARGTGNSLSGGKGNDTSWIATQKDASGNFGVGNNNAFGGNGDDKFFAVGQNNVFTEVALKGNDGWYYKEDNKDITALNGQKELSLDYEITNADEIEAFEKWANGIEDGPPYTKPPEAPDGHRVAAFGDGSGQYYNKWEETPIYYAEYRDVAYRELDAETTMNKNTHEATVKKYDDDHNKTLDITFDSNGNATVVQNNQTTNISAANIVYYDKSGNEVTNPGTQENILEGLARGTLVIGAKQQASGGDATGGTEGAGGTGGAGGAGGTSGTEDTKDPTEAGKTDETGDAGGSDPVDDRTPLPTAAEITTLTNTFNTAYANAINEAEKKYDAGKSDRNADGTYNTSNDNAVTQEYDATVAKYKAKKSVVISTGLPLITTATNLYNAATTKTDEYYTQLYNLVMKTLEANRAYFENQNDEEEAAKKVEAEKANAELQELVNSKK